LLGPYNIAIDQWSEIFDLFEGYADKVFWKFSEHEFDPSELTIIGRTQLKENYFKICDLAEKYPGKILFANPAEGSQTILMQLKRLRIEDLVRREKILLLASGDLEPGLDYIRTDGYFANICEYEENLAASRVDARSNRSKPFDFLFLNGRLRPHRKYLIDRLRGLGLLDRALWSNLGSQVELEWTSSLTVAKHEPIRLLPSCYEIDRAVPNLSGALDQETGFIKHRLFNNTWGDAIINPAAYLDSCFSVVTETIYDYPYTFRTEKIWKPIIMSHPFVVAANTGYYRSLHRAGFRTFGDVIDESFDNIEDAQQRADRIVEVIDHIVKNGAAAFLDATQHACKYNQEHLREHNRREREILPQKIIDFVNARS
jgi:hypothetical protein